MDTSKVIVIFTEGETDEVFFKKLIPILKENGKTGIKIIIKNLKGIGRYEQKAPAKLKHEVIAKFPKTEIIVFCSYDLDVFDIPCQQKPPVDWTKTEKKLIEFGASKVFHIKADKMIEDWFLTDLEGLCKFLKIKPLKRVTGKNAYFKIKGLFKRGNKIYQKGYNTNNFVDSLDVNKIYSKYKNQFTELKKQIQNK
nr:hypothetical protein [uncultured Draconibacterium sp.]